MLRILLFLALILPVSAQETMMRQVYDPVTDTHVEVLALFSKPSPGGYFPLRVKIANNLKSERSIRLDFESGSGYFGNDLQTASFLEITAGAGKTVTRDFCVPLCPGTENHNIVVNLTGGLGLAENRISVSWERSQPAVLLSEALFTPNASALDAAMTPSGSYRGSSQFSSKFDPKQLPDDWRAFSGFDCALMTDGDWTNIPPGGRNAILSWVRLGGQLMIYSSSAKPVASAMGLPDEAGFGQIAIHPIGTDLRMDAPVTLKTVSKSVGQPQQQAIMSDFNNSWPLQKIFGEQQFHYAMFVLVMIVFAILVGPINLFVFAKSGQRHKLFITTPIISLGASLIMIVLIVIQDGFGGNGVRRVLMEVRPDAGVNAAYVHQEQFSRTGVLSNSSFTIDMPVLFQPVPIAASRWARYTPASGMKGTFNLQPSGARTLASGDWWQSRSEQGHIVSAVVSTRGRIEKTADPKSFLSTFEYPIDTLFYLDEAQQWHRADGITAGKRFTLEPVESSMVLPVIKAHANAFAQRDKTFLGLAADRPGHFVAITQHAPGIATNPKIRWKETHTVITGPVI